MRKSLGLGAWRIAAGSVSRFRRVIPRCAGADGKRRPSTGLVLSAALAVVLLAVLASAQGTSQKELNFYTEPFTPPILTSNQQGVKLVEADVVVRNAKGDPVAGLKQGDFKIYDNGKEQTITQFAAVNTEPAAKAPSPSAAAGKPRFIALLFDDRSSSFKYFSYAQLAAEKFVRENVRPGDKVGVFTASNTHTLDFTDDTGTLIKTIQSLRVVPYAWPRASGCPGRPQQFPMGPYAAYLVADKGDQQALNFFSCNAVPGQAGGGGVNPTMSGLGSGPGSGQSATAASLSINSQASASQAATLIVARGILSTWEQMTESLLGSLANVIGHLAEMPGQRVVVLTSSGFLSVPLQPVLDQVASEALRGRVVINTLDARGMAGPTSSSESDLSVSDPLAEGSTDPYLDQLLKQQQVQLAAGMDILATDTGGVFFQNRNDLTGGLQQIAKVPEVSYRLGFVPSKLKDDGHLHHLRVEVTTPGSFQVRARNGYYAPAKESAAAKGKANNLIQQVLETDELGGLPAQIGAQVGRLPSGGIGMAVSLHVDPRSLTFKKAHGRHQDTLNLIVALFSPTGQFVTGETGVVDMNLKNDSLENLESRGLNATVVLKAGEGNYRLRVVMEDAGSGKTFATARSVSIP